MATSISNLRDRLRDRLGLSKFSELKLDVTTNGSGTWDATRDIAGGTNNCLVLPLSSATNIAGDFLPTEWDEPDIVEAILERARLLYMGYRGNPSQVDAALGQFFDKEAKHHDSAPHSFDR